MRIPDLIRTLFATVVLGACNTTIALAQEAPAEAPNLECTVEEGGMRQTVDVAASASPYVAPDIPIQRYFRFRAVLHGQSPDAMTATVSVWADLADHHLLLQQQTWPVPPASGPIARRALTGLVQVYSPRLGRELTYTCDLVYHALALPGQQPDPPPVAPALGLPSDRVQSGTEQPKAVPGPARVTLAFVGDVMLADGPGRELAAGRDPLREVAPALDVADLRIANLECVVSDQGRADPDKPWSFRAHPRAIPVLRRHFDAVAVANNHSGDYGPGAFADMLARLGRTGIGAFGGGLDREAAHRPWVVERQGLRIALLGYDGFFPRWFEAESGRPGVAWLDWDQVAYDIRMARERDHADLVIPMMHWGWEHETQESETQRALAHRMIDAGADAVIGGHPHVRQPIEIYRGRPVVYSLGNFVFDGFTGEPETTGWIVHLTLGAGGALHLHTITAHQDHAGTPHLVRDAAEACWDQGETSVHACVRP